MLIPIMGLFTYNYQPIVAEFPIIVGQTYTVSYSTTDFRYESELSCTGIEISNIQTYPMVDGLIIWQPDTRIQFSFDLLAAEPISTELSFNGESVSVMAVPELATVLMLLAGTLFLKGKKNATKWSSKILRNH